MDRRGFLRLSGSAVAAGAAISAVVGLSVQSVGQKSAPVDFPDFTRGRWKTQAPLPLFHM